jgi:hypothetical protein
MSSKITIKKSSVITEGVPKAPVAGDLDYGELAINYAAGRLYYKDSANNIQYFLSGVMPISLGGTGQTTQTAAFDALAPTTTKGDLIVDNGTNNVRLPVGTTNGHVLTVDSAEATGVKWAAVSGGSGGTTTNALTIGTGLSGTSFNGSSAVTIAIDSTVATLTGTQTLTNKTITSPTINSGELSGTFTGAPTLSNTTASTSSTTGALKIGGGLGVVGNIYLGSQSRLGFVNASNVSAVYQVYNATANSLDTVFA